MKVRMFWAPIVTLVLLCLYGFNVDAGPPDTPPRVKPAFPVSLTLILVCKEPHFAIITYSTGGVKYVDASVPHAITIIEAVALQLNMLGRQGVKVNLEPTNGCPAQPTVKAESGLLPLIRRLKERKTESNITDPPAIAPVPLTYPRSRGTATGEARIPHPGDF